MTDRDPLPYGEPGVLEYDPVAEGLVCHFCGGRYRNLAQHARLTHRLSAQEYRELAGLNRTTRLFAPALRQRMSEIAIPVITRLRAEGKLRRWDEDPEKLAECKSLAMDALREGLSPEGRRHAREGWSDERRQRRSEQTRRRNLDGELRADPAAIGEGVRRHYAAHPEAVDVERLRRQAQALKGSRMPRRSVICDRCGNTFESGCTRARYCEDCRPIAAREYSTRWRRNKRAALDSSNRNDQ